MICKKKGGDSEIIAREIKEFIDNLGEVKKVITAVDKNTGEINTINHGVYNGG